MPVVRLLGVRLSSTAGLGRRARVRVRIFGYGLVLVIGLLSAGFASPASAQHAEPSPVMKKLGVMAGEWRGTAQFNSQSGPVQAISYEKIESKLGGLVLWVYGRHVDATDTTRVVHEAVGMLYYDRLGQQLKFVPVPMSGLTAETWAKETEKGMDWGFSLPNNAGHIRYQVDLSQPDTWVETGDYSRDGTNWMPNIRMELKKAK